VHRCILFVGMFSILGFHSSVSRAQGFIVYTRVFPKVAALDNGGEIYRRERAGRFIHSVIRRISTSNDHSVSCNELNQLYSLKE
jgi:hypothetical protein